MIDNTNQHWQEVKCDFLNDDDGFWRVDAWKDDDPNSEGEVIAYIDNLTGRVIYTNPVARVDRYAQEVIKERLTSLKKGIWVEVLPDGRVSLNVATPVGDLSAEAMPDSGHGNGLFIGLNGSRKEYAYIDLLGAEADEHALRLILWDDIYDECYTRLTEIESNDVKEMFYADYGIEMPEK